MRFDWYGATIGADVQEVGEAVRRSFGEWHEWQPMRPRHNYEFGAELVLGHQRFATLLWGGQNEASGVHVVASGESAERLAKGVRTAFPRHLVSRLDACEDYMEAGAYEALRGCGIAIAEGLGVDAREISPITNPKEKGRTLYVGSMKSDVFARIYEKGKQLGREPDWARAELVVRPRGAARSACAVLSPLEVWGTARWSQELAKRLADVEVPRVEMRVPVLSSFERRWRFMLRQYGKTLAAMREDLGSWQAVGLQIGSDLAEMTARGSGGGQRPRDEPLS